MFKCFAVILIVSVICIYTINCEMLPGTPKIVERNGRPYIIGLLQRYDDDKPVYSYFNDDTCKWLNEVTKGETECEPLPLEEQTEESKFQLPVYQPDLRGF